MLIKHNACILFLPFHNYNLLLHLFKVLDDYEKVLLVNIGFIIVVFPFLTETLQSAQPYCAKIEWGREEKCCRRRPSLGISWLFLFPPFFCWFPPFFWLGITSHSAYVVTSTKSHGVKIDGFLYPNSM